MPPPIEAATTTVSRSTRIIACLAVFLAAGLGLIRSALPGPAVGSVEPIRVDLNSASADELDLLPRIGPALADRIIEDRSARGPYESIEDLLRVKGIGPKTVERLRPLAEVSRTSAAEHDDE